MRWDQVAWDRRIGAARTAREPRDQFNRRDESFLRREEYAGAWRIILLQINQYRQRRKIFRVEVWPVEPVIDAANSSFEADMQEDAERYFDLTVAGYQESDKKQEAEA